MKKLVQIFSFCLLISLCFKTNAQTQGLYFDSIPGTVWISAQNFDIQNLLLKETLNLVLFEGNTEDLNSGTTLWYFDEQLVIKYFDYRTGLSTEILKCKYHIEPEKRILVLQIYFNHVHYEQRYEYTPVSSGKSVLLTLLKE